MRISPIIENNICFTHPILREARVHFLIFITRLGVLLLVNYFKRCNALSMFTLEAARVAIVQCSMPCQTKVTNWTSGTSWEQLHVIPYREHTTCAEHSFSKVPEDVIVTDCNMECKCLQIEVVRAYQWRAYRKRQLSRTTETLLGYRCRKWQRPSRSGLGSHICSIPNLSVSHQKSIFHKQCLD